jgi:hypothetical protein
MKYGLVPKSQSWDRRLKAVFFWDSLELAQTTCDERAAILEVSIPEGQKIARMWNGAHLVYEYYVVEKISPINLKVVQVGEKIW